MRWTVEASEEATRDLERASQWLAQPGAGRIARRKAQAIAKAIRALRTDAYRWPRAAPTHGSSIAAVDRRKRTGPEAGYTIIYDIVSMPSGRPSRVVIVRVFGPGLLT